MGIALLALGYTWALPWTLIGWIVALLSEPRWLHSRALTHECATGGGLARWFFRTFNRGAITIGAVVIYASGVHAQSKTIRNHERRHVAQAFVLGPLYVPAYFACSLFALLCGGHVYRDNAMERDAEAHEGGGAW